VRLLIFGFRGNISEKVATGLQADGDVVLLDSSEPAISQFASSIDLGKYTHILGLGSYSGLGTSEIRIETKCTSQFHRGADGLHIMAIPFFLKSSSRLKLTNGIGNSWCNLASYQVVTSCPDTPFTFLHIPESFLPGDAVAIIQQQLIDS
jgi:hypothetical protein